MSDTHYGTEARLRELELEGRAADVRRRRRDPVAGGTATRRSTRGRIAARLRRAAALLDG